MVWHNAVALGENSSAISSPGASRRQLLSGAKMNPNGIELIMAKAHPPAQHARRRASHARSPDRQTAASMAASLCRRDC